MRLFLLDNLHPSIVFSGLFTVIIHSLRACHSLSFHLKKWSELSEPHEWKTVLGSLLRSVSLSAHRIRSLPPFSCSLLHSDFILHSHCLHSLNSFNFVYTPLITLSLNNGARWIFTLSGCNKYYLLIMNENCLVLVELRSNPIIKFNIISLFIID